MAIGGKCRTCGLIDASFPQLEWEGLVAKTRTDPGFRNLIMKAREVLMGKSVPDFNRDSVHSNSELKVTVTRDMLFIGVTEFERCFGKKAAQVDQIEIVEVKNENGVLEKGVVVADESFPWRRLQLSMSTGSSLETCVHQPDKQFRANQGEDAAKYVVSEQVREQRLLRTAPPTLEQVRKWCETTEEGGEPERAPAPQGAPLAEEKPQNSSDDEPVNNLGPAVALLPNHSRQGKKRGNGKGRGRSLQKQPKVGASVMSLSTALPGSVADGISRAGSVADSSERSRSPAGQSSCSIRSRPCPHSKLREQAQKYIKKLDLAAIAGGSVCGKEIFQATRIQQALKSSAPDSVDLVELTSHIELAKKAELIAPSKVWGLSKGAREETLKEVCAQLHAFPTELRLTLCLSAIRDKFPPKGEAEASAWASVVLPRPDAGWLGAFMRCIKVRSVSLPFQGCQTQRGVCCQELCLGNICLVVCSVCFLKAQGKI